MPVYTISNALFQTKFRYRTLPSPDGGKTTPIDIIDPANFEDDIVRFEVPQLTGVEGYGGGVRFHKRAKKQLLAAFAEIEASGLTGRILTYDGAYNPRTIRGSKRTPSNHAFGTAIDINYEWNQLGHPYARRGKKGSVVDLVPIFKKYGFGWGGDFRNKCDGMHFEVATFLDGGGIALPLDTDIIVDGVHVSIPAFFSIDTVWVAARPMVHYLNDEDDNPEPIRFAGGNPMIINLFVDGRDYSFEGQEMGGRGYVRYRDLHRAYPGKFTFTSSLTRPKLEIFTQPDED